MKKNQCILFGKRLSALREAAGLTQVQLSNISKIQRVTIAKYETGERAPSIDNLLFFSEYFNVSTDFLLGISSTESRNADEAKAKEYIGLSNKALNSIINNKESVNMLLELDCIDGFLKHLYNLSEVYQNICYADNFIAKYRDDEYDENSLINNELDRAFFQHTISVRDFMFSLDMDTLNSSLEDDQNISEYCMQKDFFIIIRELQKKSSNDYNKNQYFNKCVVKYLTSEMNEIEAFIKDCEKHNFFESKDALIRDKKQLSELKKFIEKFEKEVLDNGKHKTPKE